MQQEAVTVLTRLHSHPSNKGPFARELRNIQVVLPEDFHGFPHAIVFTFRVAVPTQQAKMKRPILVKPDVGGGIITTGWTAYLFGNQSTSDADQRVLDCAGLNSNTVNQT